jgi:D-arabinose 1-dehydrogenase-like Zn-dependent alcohol dehydrogenase
MVSSLVVGTIAWADCRQSNTAQPLSMGTTPFVCRACLILCMLAYECLGPDKAEHQGGYSTHIRAQELFVFNVPEEIKSVEAASMQVFRSGSSHQSLISYRLCGGLTVFSPLVRNGAGPGKKVGVVGLGGL